MEILTGLFIVGLYKATEKIWEKGFDAAWEPVGLALKERFTRWAGKDKETERQAAFARAAVVARANTLRYAADLQQAEKILNALNGERDKRGAEALAEEAAKLMLFSATPDVPRLTEICHRTLRFDALFAGETPLPPETVAAVLSDFLTNLREALLDEPAYHDLVGRETLRTLRQIVAELRPVAYDDEATYRAQVAEMYRQLEFVGIPELKERRPITVEDIFIRLRAEREAEVSRIPGEVLTQLKREGLELPSEDLTREQLVRLSQNCGVLMGVDSGYLLNLVQGVVGDRVEVDEALRETNRLVVLGDPGAGKTTLLKYLTVICAEGRAHEELSLRVGTDGDSPLPIFAPLREFAAECAQRGEDYCLLDHLYTCAREHLLLNLPLGFFEEALDDGRGLVCLDGLDEVWAVGQRKSVRDAVKALAVRYPRSHYLVTSRIVGYENAPLDRRDFVHHTILPFEDEDIRQFVRKWYEVRERDPVQRKQKADDLIGTIEREPRIRSLAQNPLLLTIIALVHRIEAELPHERVKLYDKCVTALVETWEEVKGLSLEEKQRPFYRYRRRLLERLAYQLHAGAEEPGQLRTVKEGDLELLLSRFLMENRRLGFADDPDGARDEARAFIHLARGRTGLLVERGEGVFGFPHLTFQEYLAACDIENRCIHRGVEAIWEEIEPHLHDPHWREVILLLLGSLNKYDEPPTLLVERILEAGKDDKFEPVLHHHLYLAARTLADKVDVAAALHRQVVDALLAIARNTPWCGGEDVVTALSWLEGDRYAAEGLLETAHDLRVEDRVRCAAALALVQLGRAEETVKVLLALIQDPQVATWVRCYAADDLGQLGHTEEVAEVLRTLARDPEVNAPLRRDSARALGQLGHLEEAIDLLKKLETEVWDRSRPSIAKALSGLGQTSNAAELLRAMVHNEELRADARVIAAEFLKQLGWEEEASGLLRQMREETLTFLRQAQSEKLNDSMRQGAIFALCDLGPLPETTMSGLVTLARDPEIPYFLRGNAAWVVGQLGRSEEAVETLLDLAHAEEADAWVRGRAAEELGELGQAEEKVLDGLLALARDEKVEDWVRHEAAEALGELGQAEEKVMKGLLELARDKQVAARVRAAAASALGQLGHAEEAEEVLLGLTRDEKVEDWLRSAAYESLKALVGVATD